VTFGDLFELHFYQENQPGAPLPLENPMQYAVDECTREIKADLGSLKADFRVPTGTLIMYLLLVLGGASAAVAIISWKVQGLMAGQLPFDELVPAGIGVGILAILAWFSYAYGVPIYRKRGLRVWTYDDGFVCLRDGQPTACRWDDVTRVWQIIRKWGRSYWRRIEVSSRQGGKWVFDNRTDLLDNFWGLTDVIENEVARRMLPRALADIRSGRPWFFGELRMTRDGLQYDGEVLPWHRFKKASCDGLTITFGQHDRWGTWKKIATDQVPNIRLLLTLVRQLGEEFGRLSGDETRTRQPNR
jgi:hypothetical protein